jgi:signal transduction histidine kinase
VKPSSIRHRLTLLVLVTAAPLIAFAVGLVLWHSQTQQELLRQQAARTVNAAMQAVDRELSGAITGLQVLAASPALAGRDFAAFHAQAQSAVGIAGNSVIILYDRQGNRIVSTAVPYGQSLSARRDMSAIGVPFETGRPHVTPLFMSETVRQPSLGIAVPVTISGEMPYVLAAGLLSERLSELLGSSGVPESWIATLLDQHGTIIARTRNPREAIGGAALPENWKHIQDARAQSGTFRGLSREGAAVFLTFSRSGTSGWTTIVGIPEAALTGALHTSLSLVAAIGAAVLLLASLLAWRAAKNISLPTHQLEDAAKALEQGEVLEVPSTGIEQFDRLAKTMHDAGRQIQEREARISSSLQELQEAHAKLREEQSKKDQFIATLAHELRNPLAPIRTGLFVMGKSPTESVAAKTLAMMDRQLSHMVRLIDDLLDVSRIARGTLVLQKEDVILQKIISYAVDGSQTFLRVGGQTLHVQVAQEPIRIHADPTRIAQVITNLLNNAAKFTPAGGSITIDAAIRDGRAEIRISDTGIGLEAGQLEAIFEMFRQIKDDKHSSHTGLGIGLSISRLLVELHGGSLEAQSEGLGRGATFIIRLPIAEPVGPSVPDVPSHTRLGRTGLRVLVVDDNVDAAEFLAAALRLAGHDPYVAHDGISALRWAEDGDADVALLDIGMPDMNGYELCMRLRQMPAYSGKKIIALTGWGAAADRQKSREAGFDSHLTKPVGWNQIEQVIYADDGG